MDLKLGGIAAAAAFILSFLIGLISQSTMPLLIIRPFIFALIFFVLFIAAKFLLSQFMPELFDGDSGSNPALFPGSVVNIMEGDNPGLTDEYSSDTSLGEPGDGLSWQAPNDAASAARPDDSDISLGDISALSEVAERKKAVKTETSTGVLSGMDQTMDNGYTGLGDLDKISQSTSPMGFDAGVFGSMEAPAKPVKKAKAAKSGSPVLFSDSDDSLPDLDSMAGVFAKASTDEESETASYTEPSSGKRKSANKEQALDGDFTPKDMAEGIRTVLKKDKEE